MSYIIIGLWIGELIIAPNRGYFSEGIMIMDRKRILANYIKRYLVVDIFCPIILIICITSQNYYTNWIKLFFIFKLGSLDAFDKIYQRILNVRRNAKAVYIIVRILSFIVALCHIIGIIFYSIDLYILNNNIV
jgi:hypothetical protein